MFKRCVFVLLSVGVLFSATMNASSMFDDSVAPQSMQTAGDADAARSSAAVSHSAASSNEAESAQVAPSSSNTEMGADEKQAPTPSSAVEPSGDLVNSAVSSRKSITLSPKSVMTMQGIHEMEQQLSTLNDQVKSVQQKNQAQISDIQGQVLVLKSRLDSLTGAVQTMAQNMSSLQGQISPASSASQQPAGSLWQTIVNHILDHYLIYIGALLALVLILFFVPVTSRSSQQKRAEPSESVNQEYDFLGSPEGVVAKLDLARAYFAMQDYAQMQTILREILSEGDDKQREAAQLLMDKIPAESQ